MKTPPKMVRCIDDTPSGVGRVNVVIENFHTMLPIYMAFDGENWQWEDVESTLKFLHQDRSTVWWCPLFLF